MTKSRELSDLPVLIPSSIGTADQVLQVNSDRSALEYASPLSAFTGLSDTPSSLSGQGGKTVAVNSGGSALEFVSSSGGLSDVVSDTSPQLGGNLDVNGNDLTSTSNGDIELDPNGSGKVIFKGNATKGAGQFQLNCENNSHGIVIKGPPHSAAASYTLTLPNNDGDADQFLQTNGSGTLTWAAAGGGGGALTVLDSTTFSSYTTDIAFIDSSSTWSNYKSLRLIARDVRADWNGPIYFSAGNGSYLTSSGSYDGLRHQNSISNGSGDQNISFDLYNQNHLELLQHTGGSGNTGDYWSGDWIIERHADSAVFTMIYGRGVSQKNQLNHTANDFAIVAQMASNQIIDRLRVRNGNGFTSGTVTLYGWKDS